MECYNYDKVWSKQFILSFEMTCFQFPMMITMVASIVILAIVAFIVRNNNYDKVFGYVGIGIFIIAGIFLSGLSMQEGKV